MRSHFALSCTAYRLFARFAQGGEVLFDAQQNATRAGFSGGTFLVDIPSTGFPHDGNSHKRRLARLSEFLEVRLYTFHEWTSARLSRAARIAHVLTARFYDHDILSKSRGYRNQY
jgi:hypothetical protein